VARGRFSLEAIRMKRPLCVLAWVLLASRVAWGAGVGVPHSVGGAVQLASLDRIQAELTDVRMRLARYEAGAARPTVADHAANPVPIGRRVLGGIEFTVVKPRFEDGAEEDLFGEMLDYSMQLAPRVWVGYIDPQQAGLRASYWQFDQRSQPAAAHHVPLGAGRKRMSIEAHAVDLECTQDMKFRHWSFRYAAGVRYAVFEQRVDSLVAPDFVFKRFHAVGPTCALENRLPLWETPLALVFAARGSLLVGESRWANRTERNETDDIGAIVEMRLGIEWVREFSSGGTTFCRFGWEQQHWFGAGTFFDGAPSSPNDIFAIQPDDHDVAFMGYGIALGATW
jgi:hypothetical protein